MRSVKIVVVLAAVLFLSGCLQSRTVVTVETDGSGTVEERFLMRNQIVQMLAGMSEEESFSILDREELERGAADFGQGVTLETAEELNTEWGSGYRALYTFEDINRLRVNQNPSEDIPADDAQMTGGPPEATEYIQFRMTPGAPASLEIVMPQKAPADDASGEASGDSGTADGPEQSDAGPAAQLSEQDLEGLATLYRDMRILVQIVVNGSIIETDASYRDGNTVTLVDMDFNRILENPDVMQELALEEPQTIGEVERVVNEIPGIKAELKQQVSVRFR
jgi:hypothetical protein